MKPKEEIVLLCKIVFEDSKDVNDFVDNNQETKGDILDYYIQQIQ